MRAVELARALRAAMVTGGLEAGFVEWERLAGPVPSIDPKRRERRADLLMALYQGILDERASGSVAKLAADSH
jgi:hypothetical protein